MPGRRDMFTPVKRRAGHMVFLAVLLSVWSVFCTGCARIEKGPVEVSRTLPLMGTYVTVKAESLILDKSGISGLLDEAFGIARELEKKLSVYDPESEINELNFSGSLKVSEHLWRVISRAGEINAATDGVFDPTIAPILKKAGFYRDMPPEILDSIPSGTGGVGFGNIVTDRSTRKVTLLKNAWLDLSGIAKGYIVDRMAGHIAGGGINVFFVDAGGDMYCGGGPREGLWRIGVRRPGTDLVSAVLEIDNMAVATSGDYENIIISETGDAAASHLADPFSFTTLDTAPRGVTVLAVDCATADGFATAMAVMDAREAVRVAETTEGVEVIIIDLSGGTEKTFFSSGAERFISRR